MSKQFSKITRDKVFSLSNKCQMCNIELQNYDSDVANYMQIDHLVAKKRGGSNKVENLRPLCVSCNSSKRDRNSLDIALKIKKDSENIFKANQNLLIRYEVNEKLLDCDIFINIIEKSAIEYMQNINKLLEEVKHIGINK